jgi:hypothetical protein
LRFNDVVALARDVLGLVATAVALGLEGHCLALSELAAVLAAWWEDVAASGEFVDDVVAHFGGLLI